MSGLIHPADLEAWHRWRSRRLLQGARARLRGPALKPATLILRNSREAPRLVVAAASSSPSARAALLAPLRWLGQVSVAVISEVDLSVHLPGWHSDTVDWRLLLNDVGAVMGDGNFLPHGHEVWEESVRLGVPYFVSQHGAITPYAPPLPREVRLLAWSHPDARFWMSGRTDIEAYETGPQLLWEAAAHAAASQSSDPQELTYLGQGHAAELGRGRMTEASMRFCRQHAATYRPHPSEMDKVSRLTHSAYRRVGITVDGSKKLNALASPVVSVFSTGVLEAAAQGRAAWVDFPRPPAWLEEFWERYGMHRFGESPTPANKRAEIEPARRIAEILSEAIA